MHSLVARLRGRAISQSTTNSTQSDEGVPRTPEPSMSLPAVDTSSSPPEQGPPVVLGRKILPHVSELMDSFAMEAERSQGLSPPPSATRTSVSPLDDLPRPQVSAPYATRSSPDMKSASASAPSHRSSRKSKSSSSKTSRSIAASVPYSTFGRQKPMASTQVPARSPAASVDTFALSGIQDRYPTGIDPLQSTVSFDNSTNSKLHNVLESPQTSSVQRSKSSSDLQHDSERHERPSPTHTTSSRPHSTRYSVMTDSPHSTHSRSVSASVGSVHTPVEQVFQLHPSPHTFGYPSPETRHNTGTSASAATSPPPLPPLVHPELVASLASRSQFKVRDISNMANPHRRRYLSFNGKTYPPHRRLRTGSGGPTDENSVPFPSGGTFGRSLRNYSSMPGVRQIFRADRSSSAPHSPALSVRRTSAEWNALQAISGVTTDSLGAWPAEVSKEILRLSLGDEALGKRRASDKPLAAVAEIRKPRDQNVVSHPSSRRPCSPPLTSHSLQDTIEDDNEGGDEQVRSHRDFDNPASIARGGVVEGEDSMSAQNGEIDTLSTDDLNSRQPATLPRATVPRAYRKSILRPSTSTPQGPEAGPSSLQSPSPPTTPTRPRTFFRRSLQSSSDPSLMKAPETPVNHKGKRKAEEIDITPPEQRHEQHATFVIPSLGHRRALHHSEPPPRTPQSRAPSSYQRKRVRLDTSPTSSVKTPSRPGSANNPADTGSVTSRVHPPPSPALRALSRVASTHSNRNSISNTFASTTDGRSHRDRRRTMSQVSIPVSALVAPHPPSIGRSSAYHMRDPHRPPPIRPTPWTPHFKSEDEEASPVHAWIFFIGFILFPLWWIASFLPIPRTRHVGGTDTEKAVTLDDPQVEHDARSWRFRCRILSAVSLVTYVPFIVLVAIFAPR